MLDFELNVDDIIKTIRAKKKLLLSDISSGMNRGMIDFKGHIIKTQMSGRPGLKVGKFPSSQTPGYLRRSWFVKTIFMGDNEVETKLATTASYARIHQYSGIIKPKTKKALSWEMGGKRIFAKQVKIPKRLHIYEEWKAVGGKYILDAIKNKIKRRG